MQNRVQHPSGKRTLSCLHREQTYLTWVYISCRHVHLAVFRFNEEMLDWLVYTSSESFNIISFQIIRKCYLIWGG